MPRFNLQYPLILFLLFLMIQPSLYGQGYKIGDWQSHFAFRNVQFIDGHEEAIYAATSNAIFKYAPGSGEFTTFTSVEGLSGVNITAIKYHADFDFLMVGYGSGLVDFVHDEEIFTLPDIQQNSSLNAKAVNNIHFAGDTAFLACDFGLVLINIPGREVQSTYFLGSSEESVITHDATTTPDSIWVATNKGVYYAAREGVNLHNYQNWSVLTAIPDSNFEISTIEYLAEDVYIGQVRPNDTIDRIYQYHQGEYSIYYSAQTYRVKEIEKRNNIIAITTSSYTRFFSHNGNLVNQYYFNGYNDEWGSANSSLSINDKIYFADENYGLVVVDQDEERVILPNSPYSNSINDVECSNGKVFLAGGVSGAKYKRFGMYFYDDQWVNLNDRNTEVLFDVRNLNYVLPDPGNENHFFACSNGYGLVEFLDTTVINHFDQDNSPLENYNDLEQAYILSSGVAYDGDKDVWMTTSQVQNTLYLYQPSGQQWQKYSLGGSISNRITSNLTAMPWGDIWFVDQDYGIVAFDPNKLKSGSINEGYKRFRVIGSDNSVLTNFVTTMAVDKDNYVWIGLDEGGLAVYYNAQSVLNYNISASRIIVEKEGIAQYLLENERVSCIAIDPGNRKWVGTQTGGVFLISEDGTEQILNLNAENSPLPTNFIRDIAVDSDKGWVYIGTDEGLVAYYSGIKESKSLQDSPKVYPNPVNENYQGNVHIEGLQSDMKVKIADVAGNIVFETMSEGGTALWNMRDFHNQRVKTGVYLIYAASADGSETASTKIFVVSQ